MSKKCPECGKFMKLTDLLPEDDEFDDELAAKCGITDEQLNGDPFEPPLCNFNYVQDLWKCSSCNHEEWNTEGQRYYYSEKTNWYEIENKLLTPSEQIAKENKELEVAGQLRLWENRP